MASGSDRAETNIAHAAPDILDLFYKYGKALEESLETFRRAESVWANPGEFGQSLSAEQLRLDIEFARAAYTTEGFDPSLKQSLKEQLKRLSDEVMNAKSFLEDQSVQVQGITKALRKHQKDLSDLLGLVRLREMRLSDEKMPTTPSHEPSPVYENLTLSRDEIRVVRLHPATAWDDQIDCSLMTLCLSDPERPQYQALSYVWGDARVTVHMKVNGLLFKGTKNLVDALRALRLQDQERIIWVDAICINQQDAQERNEQVKKMADIYRNSSATVAWLGSSARRSDQRPPGMTHFQDSRPQISFNMSQSHYMTLSQIHQLWTQI
ncbi:uncharacterized protein N0V89_001846 [Didymosphaeria variabile]|uniref:Heterokaryon incompatibility domain-containing protein n=1 Tax=Didymosphaeria variabile TaxID=1932322 RepID=A0A9W8XR17_9PLEO|nr:uncharacterized protein N0V89_001846 [Didymosphaeria variabile]KAJ4357271.1 hypothetical protein N0V89_001846 [Didymosphaeria variabile]